MKYIIKSLISIILTIILVGMTIKTWAVVVPACFFLALFAFCSLAWAFESTVDCVEYIIYLDTIYKKYAKDKSKSR